MKTKKVILNKCYGGFDVSSEAYKLYAKKKGYKLFKYYKPPFECCFERIALNEETLLAHYFVKDFGKSAEISSKDYAKYELYLNADHREDPTLIEVVEELGAKASGDFGKLKVVEIPYDLDYVIDEYDGFETLHQKVQEW